MSHRELCHCIVGVAWGCRWQFEENGVWKEVCYCEDKDGCNTSSQLRYGATFVVMTTLSLLFGHFWSSTFSVYSPHTNSYLLCNNYAGVVALWHDYWTYS